MIGLADALVPEDETVGAVRAGAIEYVDLYLAAFENEVPNLYAHGPFSGRRPFPSEVDGGPSADFPPNDFRRYKPLTRLQELFFRVELYGSDSVEGGNLNEPLVPAWPGLRSLYDDAAVRLLAWTQEHGYAEFVDAPAADRLAVFAELPEDFRDAFCKNIAEGMFAAPEYGGNTDGLAWEDYQWAGDSQPLGHTFRDPHTGEVRDDPEEPNQTRDPRWPGNALEPFVENFVDVITSVTGGRRFF
ncbi:MAG: gluconate 2-dehydrogenase subunit 3 family protein [bacterium]